MNTSKNHKIKEASNRHLSDKKVFRFAFNESLNVLVYKSIIDQMAMLAISLVIFWIGKIICVVVIELIQLTKMCLIFC